MVACDERESPLEGDRAARVSLCRFPERPPGGAAALLAELTMTVASCHGFWALTSLFTLVERGGAVDSS